MNSLDNARNAATEQLLGTSQPSPVVAQLHDAMERNYVQLSPEPALPTPPRAEDASWRDFFRDMVGKRMYETVPPYANTDGVSPLRKFLSGEKREIDFNDPREGPYQKLTGQPFNDPNKFWELDGATGLRMTTNNPGMAEIRDGAEWSSVLGTYDRIELPEGVRYSDTWDIAGNPGSELTPHTRQFDYYTNPRTLEQRNIVSEFLFPPAEIKGFIPNER